MDIKIAFKFVLISSLFMACSSDPGPNLTNPVDQFSQSVIEGGWSITLFSDSGKDETNHFTGYRFEFQSNKMIRASQGSNVVQGSWSITDSNSNDDNPDHLHFNITFSSPNSFGDLTEDWQFISQSKSKIELIHISGGNGGTDYLTFEKI